MKIKDFTLSVQSLLDDLKAEKERNPDDFRISDIWDDDGHQYVNLVQEGGGVLGLALVGFTYILEEMGIRFLSLGGTSAGSINTIMLADTGKPYEKKSTRILDIIADKEFMDFVDGGSDAVGIMRAMTKEKKWATYKGLIQNLPELFGSFGMNPGDAFEEWLSDVLVHATWKELEANITDIPFELRLIDDYHKVRKTLTAKELDIRLAIIAADITTQTKAEFPAMADLYFEEPEQVNPAEFVRASMSIPIFFEPKEVSLKWAAEKEEQIGRLWRKKADFYGRLPERVKLLDGGIMSNFPIDVFHHYSRIPNRPTIGVKLGIDRRKAKNTDDLVSFLGSMFDGVRNLRDHEFLRNNPEYNYLVESINVDGFNWLDFEIADEEKIDLFKKGAEAAARLLRRFSWAKYKSDIKSMLLQEVKPVMWELSSMQGLEDVLQVFGIRNEPKLLAKVEDLRRRAKPYNVLWVDDAFTYALPIAILDELNIFTHTVRNSDEAIKFLIDHNKTGALEEEKVNLIISDLTRIEGKADPKVRGITFAEQLVHDAELCDIPILIYAHNRKGLEGRYDKELPENIKNSDGRNTMNHKDFIREVVECIHRQLPRQQ
ncbi:MAG: patatin-like phospholipase family protein [Bacteroidota bacterium]